MGLDYNTISLVSKNLNRHIKIDEVHEGIIHGVRPGIENNAGVGLLVVAAFNFVSFTEDFDGIIAMFLRHI